MEQDVSFKPFPVSVAAGFLNQQLDAAVDALGKGIAEAMAEIGRDAGQMLLKRSGHLLYRLELGFDGEAKPLRKKRQPVLFVAAIPEGAPQFLDAPGACGFQGAVLQGVKVLFPANSA